jgi:clathrin heavy chain
MYACKGFFPGISELDEAKSFASQVNERGVWSKLGKAQLDHGRCADAIDSFIAADDPSEYIRICEAVYETNLWASVIPYLQMARKTLRDKNFVDEVLRDVGKKCYDEGLFDEAKICFEVLGDI